MFDKIYIKQHAMALKLKAAQQHNIAPEKCHIGHVILQGLLDRPHALNQIDMATEEKETNISVAKRSCRLASAMNKYGLIPGDAIIIMGDNHLDLAIPFYAAHFNGYPMCAIDESAPPGDLEALFPYIRPKMVFCQKSCEEKVKQAFMTNNQIGEIVIFDDKEADLEAFTRRFKGTEINFRPAEFDHSKIAAWLMLTSGTTGLPKVGVVPFETVFTAICSWWRAFDGKFERTLAMASLQWLSSLIFFVSGPVRCYTRIQSSAPLTPQDLVLFIQKYKPNVTAWSPYLLGQFVVAAEHGCDLSCFKYIAIGGSSIQKPLLDKFRSLCPAFLYLVYGMTELIVPIFDFDDNTPENSTGFPLNNYEYKSWSPYSASRIEDAAKCLPEPTSEETEENLTWLKNSCDPWMTVELYWDQTRKARLQKYAESNMQIADYFNEFRALGQSKGLHLLVSEDDAIVDKPYKKGELWVKGNDFFKGYLNNPEETQKVLTNDGWFKTGDIFHRDEQDHYYFVERKRLIIKHFRFQISPLQLEDVIKTHAKVNEACVVAVPDQLCLERPVAAVQMRNGCTVDPEEIFAMVKKSWPESRKILIGLFFVDSYPITPSGKVNRSKVRELALTTNLHLSE